MFMDDKFVFVSNYKMNNLVFTQVLKSVENILAILPHLSSITTIRTPRLYSEVLSHIKPLW